MNRRWLLFLAAGALAVAVAGGVVGALIAGGDDGPEPESSAVPSDEGSSPPPNEEDVSPPPDSSNGSGDEGSAGGYSAYDEGVVEAAKAQIKDNYDPDVYGQVVVKCEGASDDLLRCSAIEVNSNQPYGESGIYCWDGLLNRDTGEVDFQTHELKGEGLCDG